MENVSEKGRQRVREQRKRRDVRRTAGADAGGKKQREGKKKRERETDREWEHE